MPMTRFSPDQHSFRFDNSFETEVIQDIRFRGLCGGMAYTALDYFNASMPVPQQTFRPATGQLLFQCIQLRQLNSLLDNLDKWAELFVNPFGWRTDEMFRWGLQGTGGGRLEELRREIDAGRPVPLGLFRPGDGGAGPHHQVLAIGYDMGRYAGDLGAHQEDLSIFVHDSNFPRVRRTLKPHPGENLYRYAEDARSAWMTYFVDRKYRAARPVSVAELGSSDGLLRELLLEIRTGGDDLRGGNDNVHANIGFRGRAEMSVPNLNQGARWIGNFTQTVSIRLDPPVPVEDVRSVTLKTTFGGGIGGDNWNVDSLRVLAADRLLFAARGAPLVRFDGNNTPFVARVGEGAPGVATSPLVAGGMSRPMVVAEWQRIARELNAAKLRRNVLPPLRPIPGLVVKPVIRTP